MNTAKLLATAAFAITSGAASAATTITVDSVVQRWPWNNKVDITYTITEGQDVSTPSGYRKIVFTTVINGTTYTIDGVSDVGASANSGTHTVTWIGAPSGVRRTECTMTAAVYPSATPSGDDYLVIDLSTGAVSYEGLLTSQADSNARYNTSTYKESKLVLRKVARGTYPTGHSDYANYGNNSNGARTWMTDRDYYIGVFPVTRAQYKALHNGSGPSQGFGYDSATGVGDTPNHRPAARLSWNELRVAGTAPTSPIPTVDSLDGTFFQRLNYITGNKFAFDLPTEVMFEIAERAEETAKYYWGGNSDSSVDTSKVVCRENNNSAPQAVGSKDANNWGLFDMAGNVYEFCLDDASLGNLADAVDPWTPAWNSGTTRRLRGGGRFNDYANDFANANGGKEQSKRFRASHRDISAQSVSDQVRETGFRVSVIMD
jgi:formylglycine-generating enzyme required for sulfatase activity